MSAAAVIRRVVAHEWRVLAADRTLRAVAIVFGLLVACGLWNGLAWTRARAAAVAAVRAEHAGRLAALQQEADGFVPDPAAGPFAPSPFNAGQVGAARGAAVAALDPWPLGALAVGQSDLMPSHYKVTTRGRQSVLQGDELENPGNLLAGRFDLAFVLVYLFPLVILALSYNMLSGERDAGTLALLLAQPVRLRDVVAGKVLLRAGIVLGLAVLLPLAGLSLGGASALGGATAGAAALWMLVVVAYAALWLGVALAVNAWGRSSAGNAVVLATLWLAFAVVIPSLVNVAAASLYPVPSRVELIGRMREASNAANARGAALLARYYQDHPELAPDSARLDLNDFMTRTYSVQDEVERSLEPLYRQFEDQLAAQQALVQRARLLSPAIVAQEALNDLAGTGVVRFQRFRAAVAGFHATWQAFFLPRIMRRQPLTPADLRALPAFRFEEEALSALARRVLEGVVGLGVLALVVWVTALRRLRRVPVAG